MSKEYISEKIFKLKNSKAKPNQNQIYIDCEGNNDYKIGYDLNLERIIYSLKIDYNNEKFDNINGITIDYNVNERRLNIVGPIKFESELTYFLGYLHSIIKDISDDNTIIDNIQKSILKWKAFIEMPGSNIKRLEESIEIGLYGELLTLEELINLEGEIAIDSWKGPDYESKDFDLGEIQIETKAIVNQKKGILIHGLEQLSIEVGKKLFIHVHDLYKDESGETLHDIIARIEGKITEETKRRAFNSKLADTKYRPNQECLNFILNESQFYEVKDDFKRLDNKIYEDGIYNVVYCIELNKIKEYKVNSYK